MIGCVFCGRIERGEYEPVWFLDGKAAVVRFAPLNPVTPGHMLFVPIVHVEDAGEYPDQTGEVFKAASVYAEKSRLGHCKNVGYNLITSSGSAATQTVFHLHVHFVPRTRFDGLHLPWTGQNLPADNPCHYCGKFERLCRPDVMYCCAGCHKSVGASHGG